MRERERLNIPLIRQGLRKFKDAFSLADKDERMSKRGKGETGEIYHFFIITAFSLFFSGLGALRSVSVCLGKREPADRRLSKFSGNFLYSTNLRILNPGGRGVGGNVRVNFESSQERCDIFLLNTP